MKKTVMQYLREQEDEQVVRVDGNNSSAVQQAQKIAAKTGFDIKVEREEQKTKTSLDLTIIAKELRGLLEGALRQSGMEVSVSEIKDVTEESFSISIDHPNENSETYKFTVNNANILFISSQDYLQGQVVELGEVGVKASGEPMISREVVQSALVKYFSETMLTTDLKDLNNLKYLDTDLNEKHYSTNTISVGHKDNEARMMKQSVAEILEYGQTLHDLFTHYEQTDAHVDFPHWFQSLIIRSRDYIGKASHYLEFETQDTYMQEPVEKVRSLYNTAINLKKTGSLTLEHRQKIQKIVSLYKK